MIESLNQIEVIFSALHYLLFFLFFALFSNIAKILNFLTSQMKKEKSILKVYHQ